MPTAVPPIGDEDGCSTPDIRDARYRQPSTAATTVKVTVVSSEAELSGWLVAFRLSFYRDVRGWALEIPGMHDEPWQLYGLNTRLPAEDSTAARQWATEYIQHGDRDSADSLAALGERAGDAEPFREITEWRTVLLNARLCYVPLFDDSVVCFTPFTDLDPVTGSACSCVSRGATRRSLS